MRIISTKQFQIITVIQNGCDGDYVDLDQLLELLPYKTTKQSMQFSIRALIARGLIAKLRCAPRRGRSHVRYTITPAGRAIMNPFGDVIEISEEYEG